MVTLMSSLATINQEPPSDPARLGYPPTLPLEIALRQATPREICEGYGIDRPTWDALRHDEGFIAAVAGYAEELKKDGMTFKLKARLQAEELLKTSWHITQDKEQPAAVRADLIKFTIRAAGLDGSKDQAASAGGVGTALQININLG